MSYTVERVYISEKCRTEVTILKDGQIVDDFYFHDDFYRVCTRSDGTKLEVDPETRQLVADTILEKRSLNSGWPIELMKGYKLNELH